MNIKLNIQEVVSLLGHKVSIEQIASQVGELASRSELLLPAPQPGAGYLQWTLPGDGWQQLVKAEEAERIEVAAAYKQRCESLQAALKGSPIGDLVVQVPTVDYIYYRKQGQKTEIALVAWGYRFPDVPTCKELEAWIVKASLQKVKIGFLWNGILLPSCPFHFNGFERITQEDGFFHVDNLIPVGKTYPVKTESGESFMLTVEDGKEDYIYDLTRTFSVSVNVIRDDKPVEGASVCVSFDNVVSRLTTDASGKAGCKFPLCPAPDSSLIVPQPECAATCEEESLSLVPQKADDSLTFDFCFKTPVPEVPKLPVPEDPPLPPSEPEDITIRLFDYAGKPLPNLPFTLVTQYHGNMELVTDSVGCCKVSRKGFKDKEKMKVQFKVTKEYQAKHDLYSTPQPTKKG